MIKKLFLCLALLTGFAASSYSQDYKNEISVSYGQATVPQFAYMFGGIFGVVFTAGHFEFDNTVMTGTLGVEYNHWVNNWFGYGGAVFAEYMTSDTYTKDSNGVRKNNGTYTLIAASVMPTARFRWFNKPHFGMYSKIGAGLGLVYGSELEPTPISAQVSPVCMEFGGNSWRGIVELGVGMQGIATVGVKKSF